MNAVNRFFATWARTPMLQKRVILTFDLALTRLETYLNKFFVLLRSALLRPFVCRFSRLSTTLRSEVRLGAESGLLGSDANAVKTCNFDL